MKKIKQLSLLVILAFTLFFSCNKEKRYSKRLMKGDFWTVQSIKINDTLSDFSGVWDVTQDVNIYDSVPQIYWKYDGKNAYFQWQFQEKGKKFYINYQVLCHECEPNTLDTLDNFCNALSGAYDVVELNRKEMKFTSNTTFGFNTKKVEIYVKKKV